MTTAPSVHQLTMDELETFIQHPDPDLWVTLTPEDLRSMQARCSQHWTTRLVQIRPLHLWAFAAVLVAVVAMFRMSPNPWSDPQRIPTFFIVIALASPVVTALAYFLLAVFLSVFKLDRVSATAERLKVVQNPEFYSKFSLDTLAHSDGAQAYYDQVKAQGRDLCVVDFDVLLKLTAADRLNSPP
ncbi:MAG: hypothetical protein CFE43_18365 [Burkholderiales bacterium PBB3]|nr:MAG: hypothetical protein CFE43_18365 [Burkholderiales bacterium PBB3]